MRGRVLGVFTSSAYAAGPLGLLVAGPLVDHLGVEGAFMTLALALTVVGLATIALPDLRDLDRPVPVPPGTGLKPHAEPARGRGQGDSKPPTSRPATHPAGRHDAPTPAAAPSARGRPAGRRATRRGVRRRRGGSAAT